MTAEHPHAGAGHPVPACSRHPDRATHLRCQRCERPACTQCLQQAPVGFHCVDCVARAQASRPTPRTRFGAVARPGRAPLVTYGVIGVCAVMYVLQWLTGSALTELFWYAPLHTSSWEFEPWRMLTSAVLHSPASAMHIFFNMVALWIFGRVIEPALGPWRYGLLLLLSAFGGSVAVLFLTPATTPTVGASGAVFGLFGAMFILLRSSGSQTGGLLVLIGINAFISFAVPNISWQGHLGGLLTGTICALVIARVPRGPRRTLWQVIGLVAVAAVLVVLTGVGIPLVSPI
ncbi:rhomboid family intramembrane serine protease [Nesterenkonia suensis]